MPEISAATQRRHPPIAPRSFTLATAILIVVIGFIALAVANGVAFDTFGLPINPWAALMVTIAELAVSVVLVRHTGMIQIDVQPGELFGFFVAVIIVTGYLIYPSLPGLFPPSHHLDAVNHEILADYIFEHNALPHDFSTATRPYHLSGYPAGGALFAALVAHWTGNLSMHTVHPVIALILGLTAGIIFVLLGQLLPKEKWSKPIAFLATFLLFTAWEYFPGSVNERYFYAQTFSQFFAVSAFLFAYLYWVEGDPLSLVLMGISVGTVLLSHPTPITAPTLAVFGTIALRPGLAWKQKTRHGFFLAAIILGYVVIYALPHLPQWISLTGLGEAVPLTADSIGVFLPILGAVGIGLVILRREWIAFRFAALLLICVIAQPVALAVASFVIPNITGYYFEKSLYLLIYPLAMLSAVPLAMLAQRFLTRPNSKIIWTSVLCITAAILLVFPPRPFAPLTESEFQVASWAKAHLDVDNIAIVSTIREDAYWIHLIIFDHPPASPVTVGAYFIGSLTFDEWRGNPGKPDYAIIRNRARVPNDPTIETIYQVGDSAIVRKSPGEITASLVPSHSTELQVGDLFRLVGYDASEPLVPGGSFSLRLYWQPQRWPSNRMAMFVQLVDPTGNVVARTEDEVFQKRFPTQRWPIGVTLTDTWALQLPNDLQPGDYTTEIAVYEKQTGNHLNIFPPDRDGNNQIKWGPFRAIIPTPSTAELQSAQSVNARFGESIALRSYALGSTVLHANDSLRITLYWQARTAIQQDYKVFVHLLDDTGTVRAQVDAPPQSGARPTNTWQPGEIIKDPYRLALPKDIPPGTYTLEVGMYSPTDLKRIPVGDTDHSVIPETIVIK